MAPPLDKMFLLIAIIAMPNLYYKAQYNVPLMLFCFAVWPYVVFRSTTVYLLLFSWLIDAYCIFKILGSNNDSGGKPSIVIILQIIVFVLKIISVVLLVIFDRESRFAIQPDYMCQNLNKTISGANEN